MCYHSYERLIDLAQRTGDRLIVHNPIECQNTVIMSVDEYEKLLDNNDRFDSDSDFDCDCDDHDNPFDSRDYRNVRGLSSEQMLDQINRDIAIWRAEKEEEEEWEKEMSLEDEFADEVPFDPFSEQDYHPADWHSHPEDWHKKKDPWHSTGSVLGDRYSDKFDDSINFDNEEDDDDDFGYAPDLMLDDEDEMDSGIKVEDIPFDFDFKDIGSNNNIPFSSQHLDSGSWNEEPLDEDDEPVFYEEPV